MVVVTMAADLTVIHHIHCILPALDSLLLMEQKTNLEKVLPIIHYAEQWESGNTQVTQCYEMSGRICRDSGKSDCQI